MFSLNFESPKPCQACGFLGLLTIRWLKLKAESYSVQPRSFASRSTVLGQASASATDLSRQNGLQ